MEVRAAAWGKEERKRGEKEEGGGFSPSLPTTPASRRSPMPLHYAHVLPARAAHVYLFYRVL